MNVKTNSNFASMKQLDVINRNYSNENLNFMNKAFLIEENNNLKQALEVLKTANVEGLEDEEEEI